MSFLVECSSPFLCLLKYWSFCKDQPETVSLIETSHDCPSIDTPHLQSPTVLVILLTIILYCWTICSVVFFPPNYMVTSCIRGTISLTFLRALVFVRAQNNCVHLRCSIKSYRINAWDSVNPELPCWFTPGRDFQWISLFLPSFLAW